MPLDPKTLEEWRGAFDSLGFLGDEKEKARALALIAEVQRLQELLAEARGAMAGIGPDDPAEAEAAVKRYNDVLAKLELERGGATVPPPGRDLSRFGWSEEDFEGGGVTIK
jgi:hypothetical protein